MRQNVLTTNGTKHTHVRTILKHSNGRPYNELVKVTKLTPRAALFEATNEFIWKSHNTAYSNDIDGNTEYYHFNGQMKDDLRLTVHSFSCYCEPLNENQDPPF